MERKYHKVIVEHLFIVCVIAHCFHDPNKTIGYEEINYQYKSKSKFIAM